MRLERDCPIETSVESSTSFQIQTTLHSIELPLFQWWTYLFRARVVRGQTKCMGCMSWKFINAMAFYLFSCEQVVFSSLEISNFTVHYLGLAPVVLYIFWILCIYSQKWKDHLQCHRTLTPLLCLMNLLETLALLNQTIDYKMSLKLGLLVMRQFVASKFSTLFFHIFLWPTFSYGYWLILQKCYVSQCDEY